MAGSISNRDPRIEKHYRPVDEDGKPVPMDVHEWGQVHWDVTKWLSLMRDTGNFPKSLEEIEKGGQK